MEKEIVICTMCGGTGIDKLRSIFEPRDGGGVSMNSINCDDCGGKGRLYKLTAYERLESDE